MDDLKPVEPVETSPSLNPDLAASPAPYANAGEPEAELTEEEKKAAAEALAEKRDEDAKGEEVSHEEAEQRADQDAAKADQGLASDHQVEIAKSVAEDEQRQERVEDSGDKPNAEAKPDAELSGDGGGGSVDRPNQDVSVEKQRAQEDLAGVPHAEDDRPPHGAADDNLYPTGRDAQGRDVTPVTQAEIMAGKTKLAGQPVLDAYGCIIGPENAIAHDRPDLIPESQLTAGGNFSPAVLNARKSYGIEASAVTSDEASLKRNDYISWLETVATAADAFLTGLEFQHVDLKKVDPSDLRQALSATKRVF